MRYSHLIHHNPEYDEPAICARCGAPVAWEHVIEQDDGELIGYGSTCVQIVLGKALDEEEARRQYLKRERERERREEHIRRKVTPTAKEQRSARINKLLNAYMDALLIHNEEAKATIQAQLDELGFRPKPIEEANVTN